ncbi:hypothetical protein NMY22_g19732 [Coprinellus aureogranulatus]|nr:hypothetical protein NMY22_g19732 [Coprinellus aureogranulatus]
MSGASSSSGESSDEWDLHDELCAGLRASTTKSEEKDAKKVLQTCLEGWKQFEVIQEDPPLVAYALEHRYTSDDLGRGLQCLRGNDGQAIRRLIPLAKNVGFSVGLGNLTKTVKGVAEEVGCGYAAYKRRRYAYYGGWSDTDEEDEEEDPPTMGEIEEELFQVPHFVPVGGASGSRFRDFLIGQECVVPRDTFDKASPDHQCLERRDIYSSKRKVNQKYRRSVLIIFRDQDEAAIRVSINGVDWAIDQLYSAENESEPSEDAELIASALLKRMENFNDNDRQVGNTLWVLKREQDVILDLRRAAPKIRDKALDWGRADVWNAALPHCFPALKSASECMTPALECFDTISTEHEKQDQAHIKIYTDGSAINEKVGAAALLYVDDEQEPRKILHYHLGPKSKYSTYDAEWVGALMAGWMLKQSEDPSIGHKTASIYVDNQSVIKTATTLTPGPAQHLRDELLNIADSLLRGGILLRSIKVLGSNPKVVSGPSLLVDQILALSGAKSDDIGDLVNNKWRKDTSAFPSTDPGTTAPAYSLHLVPRDTTATGSASVIYQSPRIGLELSHPGTTGPSVRPLHSRIRFLPRPYRYFRNPDLLVANGRSQTFLGVLSHSVKALRASAQGNSNQKSKTAEEEQEKFDQALKNPRLLTDLFKIMALKDATAKKYLQDYKDGREGGEEALEEFIGPKGRARRVRRRGIW